MYFIFAEHRQKCVSYIYCTLDNHSLSLNFIICLSFLFTWDSPIWDRWIVAIAASRADREELENKTSCQNKVKAYIFGQRKCTTCESELLTILINEVSLHKTNFNDVVWKNPLCNVHRKLDLNIFHSIMLNNGIRLKLKNNNFPSLYMLKNKYNIIENIESSF